MKQHLLLCGAAAVLLSAGGAGAMTFEPATADIAVLSSPTVTATTATFSGPVSLYSMTGALTAATGPGTVSGMLDFGAVGTTTTEAVPSFMTFTTSGTPFAFDVNSVTTQAFVTSKGSTAITLYLLGTAGGDGFSASPASETLTLNQTGSSAYSASASIDSPPAGGVPEPASWALMLIGFGAAGAFIRRGRLEGNILSAS